MTGPDGPFARRDGHLLVGGVPAAELAERFGTPLYAYDAGVVEQRWSSLREALPPRADICYALKANPSLALCTLLARLGAGAEAASRGELLLARRAGFPAGTVVMAGPSKSPDDHREALRQGIRAVHVESEAELLRLDALASADGGGRPAPIGLRVNAASAVEERRSIIGGAGPGKFGVDEERLGEFLDAARRCRALRVEGLHAFNASNVLEADRLVGNAARIVALGAEAARRLGRPLAYVDVGGGLGIPYGPGEAPLDVAALGRGLSGVLGEMDAGLLSGARLIVEPGRFLVGEAGVYLCRVVETKVSRGRRFAMVDGGIHHLLRPVLLGSPHPLVAATPAREGGEEVWDVGGPLCTGLDVLARDARLPPLRPGDLLAVLCAGAYGFTESMGEFLSHPAPAEVVARGGRAGLARRRVAPEERLEAQSVPEFLV